LCGSLCILLRRFSFGENALGFWVPNCELPFGIPLLRVPLFIFKLLPLAGGIFGLLGMFGLFGKLGFCGVPGAGLGIKGAPFGAGAPREPALTAPLVPAAAPVPTAAPPGGAPLQTAVRPAMIIVENKIFVFITIPKAVEVPPFP
jgi:hypothetical protein